VRVKGWSLDLVLDGRRLACGAARSQMEGKVSTRPDGRRRPIARLAVQFRGNFRPVADGAGESS